MDTYEKTIKRTRIYDGRIINVRNDTIELPNGKQSYREVIEHSGGVCVIPITDDNEVILVKQFRYPYSKELLEVPAGKRSNNEDPLECGKRELKEETGCTAATFISLGELYPSPGYLEEIIYIYLAKGLTHGDQELDEDEFLSVVKMPLDKAVEMVLMGEIKDAKTQIAILKANLL